MKLIRNTTADTSCKYALIRLDKMRQDGITIEALKEQLGPLINYLEIGIINDPEECFVIKLKDINAPSALLSYSQAAIVNGDTELGTDVYELMFRAGTRSPFCKYPD